jgi:hypothetical protein
VTEALIVAVFCAGLSVLGVVLCAAEWVGVRAGWLADDVRPSPRAPEDDQ